MIISIRKLLLTGLVFICGISMGQKINIVPAPVSLNTSLGTFTIGKETVIIAKDQEDKKIAGLLNNYLSDLYGRKLLLASVSKSNSIQIVTKRFIKAPDKDGYNLEVSKAGIIISGDTYNGTFYGIQTLLQLLPETKKKDWVIPYLSIRDYPRFAYRGMHLDVSRHFFPVSFIKKYIDYLAYHKFNTFHWHLTDDQGWRIEIKKYPRLTSVGGYRNGTIIGRYPGSGNDSLHYGGYYTQDQIKDIVKYAADRYVTIIPEIEMPGHSSAAIAAYPELSCFPDSATKILPSTPWYGSKEGKQVSQTWGVYDDVFCPTEYTFGFLEDVLDEILELFPSPYIHIGGDEVPKEEWKKSAFCQQLIKDSNLNDEHGLQSYFIHRIEKYLNSKGRNIIGWDEILEGGLALNATVMSWRGEDGGIAAAKQGHNVIMTPGAYCYLDHSQTKNEDSVTIGGYTPLDKVYNYEPTPAALDSSEARHILGAQGNVWTEYMSNSGKVEYMIFPRMSALSEVLWTPKDKKDWKSFEARLPFLFKRCELWGANYSSAYYEAKISLLPTVDYNGIKIMVEPVDDKGKVTYETDNIRHAYITPIDIHSSSDVRIRYTRGTKVVNDILLKLRFNKATGKKIALKEPPSANYPGSGAFTLVNGIVTERKLSQSSEWLGFLGKDMDAIIDLGKPTDIHSIKLDVLSQNGSWIYLPSSVAFYSSDNGTDFALLETAKTDSAGKWANERQISLNVNIHTQYIKVVAKNYGTIPSGQPGASNPAWLFVDEIEIY